MKERLMEILRNPIYPHLDADPIEALADYLIDSGVVLPIHCKDCKHWTYDNYHKHHYCSNAMGLRYVCPENNFCSYGERRTDAETD